MSQIPFPVQFQVQVGHKRTVYNIWKVEVKQLPLLTATVVHDSDGWTQGCLSLSLLFHIQFFSPADGTTDQWRLPKSHQLMRPEPSRQFVPSFPCGPSGMKVSVTQREEFAEWRFGDQKQPRCFLGAEDIWKKYYRREVTMTDTERLMAYNLCSLFSEVREKCRSAGGFQLALILLHSIFSCSYHLPPLLRKAQNH